LSIIFYVLVTVVASMICLSQTGLFDNSAVWAQEVPLIPINSGNATLDQGLPVFYDCLEEVVDESYTEQEDNYFQNEPRKSEVIECYYQVFVNSEVDSLDTGSNDFNDNAEESEAQNDEKDEEETLFG
jgi:hypothetical protein